MLDSYELLQPFGSANPEPLLMVRRVSPKVRKQLARSPLKISREALEAVRAEGLAEAAAEAAARRDVGLAEAEAILARGEAEAEARRKLAEALKLYNEAGLSIEALKVLPEIAAAVSEPLARAGETTIISSGGPGEGTGTSRLTEDVVQVMTQLGPIMKQLSKPGFAFSICNALTGTRPLS